MITLASIIDQFEADFLRDYQNRLRPNQISALHAMKCCRTSHSPVVTFRYILGVLFQPILTETNKVFRPALGFKF